MERYNTGMGRENLSESMLTYVTIALPYILSAVIAIAGGLILNKANDNFERAILEKTQVESRR